MPGQSVNIDLCFVPATHEPSPQKLPAVSGSSGHLVIERPVANDTEKSWPGKIFEDERLEYEDAMLEFVKTSQDQQAPSSSVETSAMDEVSSLKAQKRALRQEEEQLRNERRIVRQQRKDEDESWKAIKHAYREKQSAQSQLSKDERKALEREKRAGRQQRKQTVARRQEEDTRWRQQRQSLRERWSGLPVVTAWIAILVMTDNCSRQCLGLPLFVAGPKVTADMIAEALGYLLPKELQFLITDRGVPFRANAFQLLVRSHEFIHVLIARHRPQSNGIAERFVRTLKEWLKETSWGDEKELAALLAQFVAEYNERPHQGLPIPGLSPNEFANRIWLY